MAGDGRGKDDEIAQADLVGKVADEGVQDGWDLHEGVQYPGGGQGQGELFDDERQEGGDEGGVGVVDEVTADDSKDISGLEGVCLAFDWFDFLGLGGGFSCGHRFFCSHKFIFNLRGYLYHEWGA